MPRGRHHHGSIRPNATFRNTEERLTPPLPVVPAGRVSAPHAGLTFSPCLKAGDSPRPEVETGDWRFVDRATPKSPRPATAGPAAGPTLVGLAIADRSDAGDPTPRANPTAEAGGLRPTSAISQTPQ